MLNPSPEFVVRAYFEAWGRGAIDEALNWLSEDVHWTQYLGTDIVPFGGTSGGRDRLRERMVAMLTDWELLDYTVVTMEMVGQSARVTSRANFRYRATGDVLDLSMRHEMRLIGKQIVFADEYHDAERIRAFMKLVAQKTEEQHGN